MGSLRLRGICAGGGRSLFIVSVGVGSLVCGRYWGGGLRINSWRCIEFGREREGVMLWGGVEKGLVVRTCLYTCSCVYIFLVGA